MTIVFSSVVLKKAERDLKRGLLHFSASLTKPVLEGMKWTEPPRSFTSSSMVGEIVDASLAMTAKQESLFEEGEFRADVQTLTKFEITRMELKGKKGKGFRHVVTFEAKFIDGDILALADSWIRSVGDGTGTLTVKGTLAEASQGEEAAA